MTDKPVGLDRYLQKGWLDLALELSQKGSSAQAAKHLLEDRLQEEMRGAEARKKTITVLNRVWLQPQIRFLGLRDEALALSSQLGPDAYLALHWGLLMVNYPFFYAIATHLGRLLQLQGQTNRAQIRRRMVEEYGERTSVQRSIGMALQSFVHWQVIREDRQIIQAGERVVLEPALLFWLARILAQARESHLLTLSGLYQDPAFFPLILPNLSARDFEAQGFEVLSQASGSELLIPPKCPAS